MAEGNILANQVYVDLNLITQNPSGNVQHVPGRLLDHADTKNTTKPWANADGPILQYVSSHQPSPEANTLGKQEHGQVLIQWPTFQAQHSTLQNVSKSPVNP